MSWCAAVYCNNKKAKNPDKTFFGIPSDEKVKKQWLNAINRTDLPRHVSLCSDHFDESCFDQSWQTQSRLLSPDRPIQRKLLKGSIPTLFPHKPIPKVRETSEARFRKQRTKEVWHEICITNLSLLTTSFPE